MKVRDMLDIRAICEAGSFRRAAEVLGITQPTLSKRIAYLEQKLGAPLFERRGGRSLPTDLARIIASRAESINRDVDLLFGEISRLARGQGGLVRLGVGPVIGRSLLTELIMAVAAKYPRVALAITVAATSQLRQRLLARELDLLVCHPIPGAHPSILKDSEYACSNVVVAHPRHAMFQGVPPGLGELVRFPIAMADPEDQYRAGLLELGVDIDTLEGRVTCSDFDVLIRLVKGSTRYFTAGPEFVFEQELASGELRKLEREVPFTHRLALYRNGEAHPLPAVDGVHALLHESLSALMARLERPSAVPGRPSRG